MSPVPRLIALAAVVVLTVACSPDASPAAAPPSHAARSATPTPSATPTRPPLPLKKQDPCELLSPQDKARTKAGSRKYTEKRQKTRFGIRSCQYSITRAADGGSFFIVTFGIVEYGGMYSSTDGLPTKLKLSNVTPVEPVMPIGRHRGALTSRVRNGYLATYSISVTKKSRVDVTFVAGTYGDNADDGALYYARLIEPRLP